MEDITNDFDPAKEWKPRSKWQTREWWAYLFAPVERNRSGFIGRVRDCWTSYRCRLRGHPYGVVWYNPGGWEPDMTCKNCGDDLG